MSRILLLLVFGFPFSGYAQCDRQADSLALVALYNSTGGSNWTKSQKLSNSNSSNLTD